MAAFGREKSARKIGDRPLFTEMVFAKKPQNGGLSPVVPGCSVVVLAIKPELDLSAFLTRLDLTK